MCVLAQNIINEKIYMVFWWWLLVLFAVALSGVVIRMFCLAWAPSRVNSIKKRVNFAVWNKIRYRDNKGEEGEKDIETYFEKILSKHFIGLDGWTFRVGDWFLLHQISQNVDPLYFTLLVKELWAQLGAPDDQEYEGGDSTVSDSEDTELNRYD